jgi:Domain of unknown function (DUF4388)
MTDWILLWLCSSTVTLRIAPNVQKNYNNFRGVRQDKLHRTTFPFLTSPLPKIYFEIMQPMMANNKILSGQLQEITLTDLLQNLISSKSSGTLTLQYNQVEKSIYIKEGHIVFASSNLPEDRLGNVLIQTGKMTQEQVEAALKLKGATNRRFGAIVVELGFLPPKALFEGLKLHVREIIYSLFRWEEGAYRFTPGGLPQEIVPLVLDPIQLISEIINRLQAGPVDGA